MSGTPIVTGSKNIIDPLLCLKDDRGARNKHYVDPHEVIIEEHDDFELRWNQLIKTLKAGKTNRDAAVSLATEFGSKISDSFIRRLKHHLWFQVSMIAIPPAIIKTVVRKVSYPEYVGVRPSILWGYF